jgi:hypothetical protein
VVVVGAVTGGDDDGGVVVVDRPRPPEDRGAVLVVDGSVGTVEGEEVDVVGSPESSSGELVVVVVEEGSVEGSEEVVVVVVDDDGSVGGVVSSVVDVVAVSFPGSGSPRSARAGAAGMQTTAKNRVAAVTARRTRIPSTRIFRSLERQRRRAHRVREPSVTHENVPK